MAHGIQYVQATQFLELPSSSARGVPELRNKKCLNPNLTCGTRIWGRSKDESLEEFQTMIREMFLGDDRVATKAYLKLFIEQILINLPRIDITCKSNVLLAALENKTAVRSGEILTADMYWLPSADSNHGHAG